MTLVQVDISVVKSPYDKYAIVLIKPLVSHMTTFVPLLGKIVVYKNI